MWKPAMTATPMRVMAAMACANLSAAVTTASIKAKLVMMVTCAQAMVAIRNAAERSAVMVVWTKARPVMTAIVSRQMFAATIASLLLVVMVFAAKISLSVRRVMRLAMTVIEFRPMRA